MVNIENPSEGGGGEEEKKKKRREKEEKKKKGKKKKRDTKWTRNVNVWSNGWRWLSWITVIVIVTGAGEKDVSKKK